MLGVYIHIPFCKTICSYCDFCKMHYNEKFVCDNSMEHNVKTAVCASAYNAAKYLDAKAIVVMTRSGATARILSYFHPSCPIIAATIDDAGLHQLNLVWGVTPIAACDLQSTESFVEYAIEKAKESR